MNKFGGANGSLNVKDLNFPGGFKVIAVLIILAVMLFAVFTSAIYVHDDQSGVVIVKLGKDLPPGQIIATHGEKGPQAEVLPPGWHFFYWPWRYSLKSVSNIDIPEGSVGVVMAKDGKPLPPGEVYAKQWDSPLDMLDGMKFLTSENGHKGPQLTVLPPGQYRFNPRLFQIQPKPALTVNVGEVVVVKANAGERYEGDDVELVNGVPIVPNGYRGIWRKALTPNQYYMHPDAFETVHVRTSNRIYSYLGTPEESNIKADNSIGVRTKDGFEFPVDVRVSAKISAEDAPYVVAQLADPDSDRNQDGFDELEEIVILPAVRAIFRNSAEQRGALEYVNTRSQIEKAATQVFKEKMKNYSVSTDGLFVADIGLSKTPEGKVLLKTQTDKEVAKQEQETWHQKKLAEDARAESVKAQTEAEKEKNKVEAKVQIQIAMDEAQAEIERANGKAQAARKEIEAVGGFENYIALRMAELLAERWKGDVPEVLVSGEGGIGLQGALQSKLLQQVKAEGKIGAAKKATAAGE